MATRKSGIPVKSSIGSKAGGVSPSGQARSSSIPVKKAKNEPVKSATPAGEPLNSPKRERELQEAIKRLEGEVKDKNSAINDLNEKLMQRINECQVLQEENEIAKENLHLPSDHEVSGKIKDLEKLLNEKETFIEKMLTNKQELERKFEVELDMLKNQHEIELLSLEQRLQDAHQEKMDELETSLKNVNGPVKEISNQSSSAEINTLHEELMRTKLRYENQIFDLKQQLEMVTIEKDDLIQKQKDERNEVHSMKEKHKEEIETLKYLVQEKDVLINDSTSNREAQHTGFYTDEDVTRKLEELRTELTTQHEYNLQLANDLWRKKFEENRDTDLDRTKNQSEQGADEVSDLKEQLQESHDLQEEQNEILETQEKEIEELRESNKEFEERYITLYKEMETKWQSEFSESEIIEKIKSHYEMEIERLHGELEDIQNENGNLKSELDLMANDFDGGHSRGPLRRPSVTARLDMKVELEDYKVQIATLERDLQHALNQNERLKLESGVKNGELAGSKLEVTSINNKVDELQTEREKLIAEKDDFRAKFEEMKKERKKLEKDLKIRDDENTKMSEELQTKNDKTALLENDYETGIKNSEALKVLEMKENISELSSKCEKAECDLVSLRETLEKSENRKRELKEIVEELKAKEVNLTQEFTEAKSKILALEGELNVMSVERNSAQDELNKLKDIEEGKVAETKKRVTELENMLAQGKVANEALKVKYDKLLTENETKTSKLAELKAALSEEKTEFEKSEVKSDSPLEENNTSVKSGQVQPHEEEYDLLTRKYEKAVQENETKSIKISEIESLFREKNIEYVKLNSKYSKLCEQDKSMESRITDLETEINQQKIQSGDLETLNNNLKNENVILEAKVCDAENLLKQSKDECEALKRNKESLCTESEKKISAAKDVEAALNKSREEYQRLNEDYQKVLGERSVMVSDIEKLEKDANQVRKQITAFEKKVAMQEREKKGLEEKVSSSAKIVEGQKKELLSLKEKCESYDWKNTELETKLEGVRNTEDRLKTYMERNQELLCVIEEATREKRDLLTKQTELMERNKELKGERDTLKNEKGVYESEREQDSSEHERKLETTQKKLKEKDRVLNETKKHCKQLKESEKELKEKFSEKETKCSELEEQVKELNEKLKYLSKEEDLNETKKQIIDLEGSYEQKNKQCLDLEGRLEQVNSQNTKLKQQLEETKNVYSEQEQVWRDEIKRQKDNFAHELKNVQENMEQSARTEISRLSQDKHENEEMRKEMTRLKEENHALKIRLDDQGIEVSKEKEEKYKMEKLKDQFRFQVESLQERLDAEHEKMSVLENEHLRDEKRINEERKKLLATLDEYEMKNSKILSNIDKASGVLKTTKEKYVKLKEKFNSLAKKYKKMNEEKLNKSDVQVGPDTSVDLSLVVEDLQRSKETAEETNLKLRIELDKLREEIGRSEYQIKAVRKANVVLMKQSRVLYQESEEHKRLDEERALELQKYRDMKENLQQDNNTSKKQRELLEEQVNELAEETAKLKRENDEYFLEKNRREIDMEEKANECVSYSRQVENLKQENKFLYQQGRKLQAELDVTRMKPMGRVNSKLNENRNFFYGFDNELTKGNLGKDTLTDLETIKGFGTGRLSEASQLGESTSSLSFDEARSFIPPVFNNEKILGDKVIESANKKNAVKSSPPPNKDINLQISKINNEFATEKYLGKTYWDTLEFLKKK